ncbi:AbiTii domain-containing protein [Actinoplanes subglobosus]|uniref:AbiTii domain-containing protein n=1 Tax=Actinoplanes subglobosus TaxID=1547892 RepID=A0ABV8IWM1_9ACTN
MPISHRSDVENQLLDTGIRLSTGLRALAVLAKDHGKQAVSDWAAKELDGYPASEPLPTYRRFSPVPLLFLGINQGGRTSSERLDIASLSEAQRETLFGTGVGRGLHHGVTILENRQMPGRAYAISADPAFRPDLPLVNELIQQLDPAPNALWLPSVHWRISTDQIKRVLDGIRAEAVTRARALPDDSGGQRKQIKIATYSASVATLGLLLAGVALYVNINALEQRGDHDREITPANATTISPPATASPFPTPSGTVLTGNSPHRSPGPHSSADPTGSPLDPGRQSVRLSSVPGR